MGTDQTPTSPQTRAAPPATTSSRARGWRALVLLPVLALVAIGARQVLSGKPAAPARRSTMTVGADAVTLTEDAPQWRYIQLGTAREAPVLAPLPAPARVAFDEKRGTSVSSPLPGRVEHVLVRVGDRVAANARLFSVRSGAWAELHRELEAARAALTVKGRVAERARELVELRAAPEKDQLIADAERLEAELTLKAAQAKSDTLRVTADGENLFWVTAPRAGTVVELDVFANQEVTPDRDKPLLRISDLDEVLVLADVQEPDAPDLVLGTPVVVRSQTDLTRSGVIDHISEVVDPKRRTIEVRIRVENRDRALRPNAFVEVSLSASPNLRRVRVPAEAVVTEGGKPSVFVAREGNRLEPVPVTIGRQREGEVELRAGLQPGTRYVAKGALLLLNEIELAR